METNNDILDELNALSPRLVGMRKVNVYTVPEGYFDSISDTVLACLNIEQVLPGAGKADVPAGYFDNLAGSIFQKIKAAEQLSGETETLSPVLAGLKKINVFEVPAGYFEGNVQSVLNQVTIDNASVELRQLSPLLYSIQNEQVFTVPAGYFTNLPAEMSAKVQPVAKVVKMPRRNIVTRFAVAAMVIGLAAFGVIKYAGNNNSTGLPTQVAALDASIEKGRTMDEQQFNATLKNLTNADIASYLEVNGDLSDITALGNNLDETILPKQEDYLLDDKTLENYLKQIESSSLKN
ncbi:MAG: hypothetical protein Q7T76_20080 [Ferruginibacter sp.]|nr:hypothetical protein [Ferruginibacter sp.]